MCLYECVRVLCAYMRTCMRFCLIAYARVVSVFLYRFVNVGVHTCLCNCTYVLRYECFVCICMELLRIIQNPDLLKYDLYQLLAMVKLFLQSPKVN